MRNERESLSQLLLDRLESEKDYKARCDNGEVSQWDIDYECEVVAEYHQTSWRDAFDKIIKLGYSSEEIRQELTSFLEAHQEDMSFIPQSFIRDLQTLDKKKHFEEAVMRDDVVEYFSSKSKEELEAEFGKEVARMKDFDQMNPHHCYDLLGHTLHTVDGIKRDGLTPEQYKELRISAFLHDIGKPEVAKMHPKIKGQQVFYGHAEKSASIARRMLSDMGYDREQIDRMSFYIGHHDDFISYKTQDQITPAIANHEFIRGITPETVAEIMFQNEYNGVFERNGYSKDQVKYICYALAHGKEPNFVNNGRPVRINSSMQEAVGIVREHDSASYYSVSEEDSYNYQSVIDFRDKHSLEDYQMLMHLCRADAGAQSEVVKADGRVVASKAGKIANMDSIDACLPEAKRIFDLVKLSNLFIGNITKSSPKLEVIDMDKLTPEEADALWEEEEEYMAEYGDYSNEYMHKDVSSWLNLMGKSSAFLAELRKKIEEQRETAITDDIEQETFDEYYKADMEDLDRITKVRTRKENLKPLEAQLAEQEETARKLTEAEQLLLQVKEDKRKGEGR
ncbi:MAG: HD domain-containing protein [Clostridia bacterium]